MGHYFLRNIAKFYTYCLFPSAKSRVVQEFSELSYDNYGTLVSGHNLALGSVIFPIWCQATSGCLFLFWTSSHLRQWNNREHPERAAFCSLHRATTCCKLTAMGVKIWGYAALILKEPYIIDCKSGWKIILQQQTGDWSKQEGIKKEVFEKRWV